MTMATTTTKEKKKKRRKKRSIIRPTGPVRRRPHSRRRGRGEARASCPRRANRSQPCTRSSTPKSKMMGHKQDDRAKRFRDSFMKCPGAVEGTVSLLRHGSDRMLDQRVTFS